MSALKAAGDVVIFAGALGAVVAVATTAQTVPGMVWGGVGIVFAACIAFVAWEIWCDALADDDPAEITRPAPAPRQWTPDDAREISGRSNSFRPDAWADDPDRTTRRDTYL